MWLSNALVPATKKRYILVQIEIRKSLQGIKEYGV
jgi:hypothetical protein